MSQASQKASQASQETPGATEAPDRHICAADVAALRRIYKQAQALRYAMRDAATAPERKRQEMIMRANHAWEALRTLLEQAALNEQHPGAVLSPEDETSHKARQGP